MRSTAAAEILKQENLMRPAAPRLPVRLSVPPVSRLRPAHGGPLRHLPDQPAGQGADGDNQQRQEGNHEAVADRSRKRKPEVDDRVGAHRSPTSVIGKGDQKALV